MAVINGYLLVQESPSGCCRTITANNQNARTNYEIFKFIQAGVPCATPGQCLADLVCRDTGPGSWYKVTAV